MSTHNTDLNNIVCFSSATDTQVDGHAAPETGAKLAKGVVVSVLQRALGIVLHWMEISRQRRDLARLDDRMLMDIGVSRSEADREVQRPFWDVPHR